MTSSCPWDTHSRRLQQSRKGSAYPEAAMWRESGKERGKERERHWERDGLRGPSCFTSQLSESSQPRHQTYEWWSLRGDSSHGLAITSCETLNENYLAEPSWFPRFLSKIKWFLLLEVHVLRRFVMLPEIPRTQWIECGLCLSNWESWVQGLTPWVFTVL